MLSVPLVIGASFAYLLLLFGVAHFGDRRARQGRSVIGNAWVYALSMGVYCTAWTYFGSIGRAASSGVWFLPIYLGPTLAMVLAWMVVRKMIRISRSYRITSIADFIASRYGKSRLLAALVTLIAVVGILPYVALQLKAIASGYAVLTTPPRRERRPRAGAWWLDSTLYIALALAGFTVAFGTRHLDTTERHEGMVAAIAVESVIKLLAFLAVGAFVTWGLFDGPADIFARARAVPESARLLRLEQGARFAYAQWFALTLLAMLSVIFLPRQFQMMVVENVDERHLKRAAWVVPALHAGDQPLRAADRARRPAALRRRRRRTPRPSCSRCRCARRPAGARAGGLHRRAVGGDRHGDRRGDRDLDHGLQRPRDALAAADAALRRGGGRRPDAACCSASGAAVIVALLLLGYLYFRLAGEAYALVSIGLISFAAVAQFAPALLARHVLEGRHARRRAGRAVRRASRSGSTR